MPSEQHKGSSSDAASTFTESTTYSYSKPSESQSRAESQPKKSWRKKVKETFKDIGLPPTHQYDLQQDKKRPEYGIFGQSVFTDNRNTRMN